jgi:hypothetical protein
MRRIWEFAKALTLGEFFSNPIPLEPSSEFRRLAFDFDCSYEELYLTGLRNGDYNIQLIDYAYLQFGITKDDHVRFAYYPNPFLGAPPKKVGEISELREYVAEGIVEIEEYLNRISEIRNSQHPPLTRYENAPDDYREFEHPCSHFHFGHHRDNRWAIQRVLTPFAFALLIFQHYYPTFWMANEPVDALGKKDSAPRFLALEKMSCRQLPSDLFSLGEQALFAFS